MPGEEDASAAPSRVLYLAIHTMLEELAPTSNPNASPSPSPNQASTTAWFLEGFNYALRMKVDLISLSVGGPDYRDAPFVAKVR